MGVRISTHNYSEDPDVEIDPTDDVDFIAEDGSVIRVGWRGNELQVSAAGTLADTLVIVPRSTNVATVRALTHAERKALGL